MNITKQSIVLLLLLLALIIPSHFFQIERAVTVDEPWWLISGSNYYYALTHKDFASTLYDYHPAVTTTWVVTLGMVTYFPEYRGGGQGYFDVRKPHFEEFLRENGKDALDLMRISRWIQTVIILLLAVLSFLFLRILLDDLSAFIAIALAMNAPFFLGHSRILNHEGMLAMFVLTSFLGMQVYLGKDRKLVYLLISGAAFGLAQLTKSSSIVLLGVIGLMLLTGIFNKENKTKILDAVKIFATWFAIAALTYFILWPGMWSAPGKMLSEIYGNAFSYAFQGARLDVTEELQPSSFSLVTGFSGIFQYVKDWAASSTPLTWLGLIFSAFIFFLLEGGRVTAHDRRAAYRDHNLNVPPPLKPTITYLLILGGLFIAMFGLAQGRNSQHYILSSYVAFDVVAGIGWGFALSWIVARNQIITKQHVQLAIVILLALTQIGVGLPFAPYYLTYKAPFASQAATYGYGEGLAEASDYLSAKPDAGDIHAYVYNGMGTFSFFFPGETLVFKRAYLVEDDFATIIQDMKNSDYLVLYPIVRDKQPETEKILKPLEGVTPEKTIYINGLEYIRIYKISDIPESVYAELGQ